VMYVVNHLSRYARGFMITEPSSSR
jgi:hypothetical protein